MKKELIFNKKIHKNDIKNIITWFLNSYGSIRTNKLVDKLKTIGFNTSTEFGISLGLEDLRPPKIKKKILKNTKNIVKKENIYLARGKINIIEYQEKKNKIWNKTNNIITSEITKNFEETDSLNSAYIMIISGARGNLSQIKQLIGMRGLMADAEGEIINTPIKNNLKEGIDINEYFISCYGARKGVIDTALKTANSGYLTRKLIYVAQQEIIKKPDCTTKSNFLIKNLKLEKNYFEKIKKILLGRVLAKNCKIKIKEKEINLTKGQDICRYLIKKLAFSKKIYIRTPLSCLINNGVCQLCYGWNLGNGRIVELGETVGIIAAQSIGEPGTQLTMRTFHTGGVINVKSKETILAPCSGILTYKLKEKGKLIETKNKEKGILNFYKIKISILPKKSNKIITYIPKKSIIFIKNKEKVYNKQIIAEKLVSKNLNKSKNNKINNKTLTIKTNISGLIEKTKKDYLKITNGNIVNYYNLLTLILFKKHEKIKINYKVKKNYSQIYKKNKNINNINKKTLFLLKTLKSKTNFIKKNKIKTYILKKNTEIEKIFLINKIDSQIVIKKEKEYKLNKINEIKYKYKKNKYERFCMQLIEKKKLYSSITKTNVYKLKTSEKNYFQNKKIVKKQHPIISIEYEKEKIKDIVEGLPKIQQLFEANHKQKINKKLKKIFSNIKKKYTNKVASKKSLSIIQKYILKKIKKVYSNQGININQKHFEMIIKKMTSKVIITKSGESNFLTAEITQLNKVEKINKNIEHKAKYEPIIIGISKTVKLNEGFLSSASFQETTTVISKAVIEGKIDWLNGLKENILLGNIIPGGTGKTKA